MRSALVVLLVLAGCANAEHIAGPEGPGGQYRIKCTYGDDGCHRKARDVCPNDFRILSGDNASPDTTCSAMPTWSGSHCESEMIIECLR